MIASQVEQFSELNCEVVVVARGVREDGLKWLETTGYTFPLLLDINRELYNCFGLGRSVAGVWTIAAITGYAEEKLAGIPTAPHYPGDDLHTMGGDFIVDSAGKPVYIYCSKTSQDRPDVSELLTSLRNNFKEEC